MAVGAILRGPRHMAMVYIVVAMAGLWLLVPPAARSVNSLLLRTVTASHGVVNRRHLPVPSSYTMSCLCGHR